MITDILLNPPVLFFILGVLATLLRSDLEIPSQATRFLSLYLLFAIGLHGGYELSQSQLDAQVILVLAVSAVASLLMPIWSFFVLRLKLGVDDAAAIAATYGSISAVTFITAVGFLNVMDVSYGGHLIAAMALMESPAIICGVLLARFFSRDTQQEKLPWSTLGREAFFNGAVFLLIGSLIIGYLTGEDGWAVVKPIAYDPFKGVLCFFLLDMGLVAAKRLRDLKESGAFLIGFGILAAAVHAMLGIAVAKLLGVNPGDALLLAVLFGSASYIAVPAAVRLAIPKASPSLYVPMSLGVTFPFNVVIGIPLYYTIIQALWSPS